MNLPPRPFALLPSMPAPLPAVDPYTALAVLVLCAMRPAMAVPVPVANAYIANPEPVAVDITTGFALDAELPSALIAIPVPFVTTAFSASPDAPSELTLNTVV